MKLQPLVVVLVVLLVLVLVLVLALQMPQMEQLCRQMPHQNTAHKFCRTFRRP